jgi:hypothetical protein
MFFTKYGQISVPLTTLLKNEAFSWTKESTRDFENVKEVMCTTPILGTHDFTKTFIVECDASSHGTGGVLMQ